MSVGDVQGKLWRDNGGPSDTFSAENMNKLRPFGFVSVNRAGLPFNPFEVLVAPARWRTTGGLVDFPGATGLVLPSTTNYVYLDGSQTGAAQLVVNQSGFPAVTTENLFYLAEVVTNASEVVEIVNLLEQRTLAGSGVVQSLSGVAPVVIGGTPQVPTISVPDATGVASGLLPAADKSKLDSFDYSADGSLIQGASGGPSVLPIGSPDEGLRVNAAGDALEYAERFPPAQQNSDLNTFTDPATSLTIVPSCSLAPPPGRYLVMFHGTASMSAPGSNAFLQIRKQVLPNPGTIPGALANNGAEQIVSATVNTPFGFSAFVDVAAGDTIQGTVIVTGGANVTIQRRSFTAVRIATSLTP